MQININAFTEDKRPMVRHHAMEFNADVIFMAELKSTDTGSLGIADYRPVLQPRTNHGGGVGMYLKDRRFDTAERVDISSTDQMELVVVDVSKGLQSLRLASLYCPPPAVFLPAPFLQIMSTTNAPFFWAATSTCTAAPGRGSRKTKRVKISKTL